jgi:ubiquinone/menaquinone biosynthesis C-methylase UbiE
MQDNSAIWSGRAEAYDAYRPQPPTVILDMFTQLIHQPQPQLVVDLGCGTGLSTMLWAGRSAQVIGIEPNDDMRQQAEKKRAQSGLSNVRYQAALAQRTGLPADSADIVTCSQSLHWMEPEPTFAEIARILRPGGLFAAYDYDWPPTVSWEVEVAYRELMARVNKISRERGIEPGVKRWSKERHLDRMQASGRFRYVKEVLVHHVEMGDAERFIGLTLSNYARMLLQRGLSEEEIGVESFKATVQDVLSQHPQMDRGKEEIRSNPQLSTLQELAYTGKPKLSSDFTLDPGTIPFYFSYHIRIGIK